MTSSVGEGTIDDAAEGDSTTNPSYDAENLWPDYASGQMSRCCAILHGSLGCSAHRSNLFLVRAPDSIAYIAGHQLVILSLEDDSRSYLSSHDAAIGSIAIHPSNSHLAVAEGNTIVVYLWPNLAPVHVLRKGTERGYADLSFNTIGDQLASVGMEPDYSLIIWNWAKETILLRTKAFSQDIYRVRFSPRFAGRLVTCGTGHIRFWTMARTFTGMKLQGHIGKFGAVDLSDIVAFAELPDGKVICGTETGDLLVWEDALIAYTITQSDGKSCHDGMIEHIEVDHNGTQLLTAGHDGKIKRWNIEELTFVDLPDNDRFYRMMPTNVYELPGVSIVALIAASADQFFIQNSNGSILHVQLSEPLVIKVLQHYHAGAINAVLVSRKSYDVVTFGQDHTIQVWDLVSLNFRCETKFSAAITSANWVTPDIAAAGFADGTLRCLEISSNSIRLLYASKPHRQPIRGVSCSGAFIATASDDRTVFLFHIASFDLLSVTPVGFVEFSSQIHSIDFDPIRNDMLLVATDLHLYWLQCPKPDSIDTMASFQLAIDLSPETVDLSAVISAKKMQKARAAAEQSPIVEGSADPVDAVPGTPVSANTNADDLSVQLTIRRVKFSHDGTTIYLALDNDDYGQMIISCNSNTFSLTTFKVLLGSGVVSEIQHGLESDLIVSLTDGSLSFCRNEAAIRIVGHNRGFVHQSLSFDGRFLVSCGSDGNLHVYRVNIERAWECYRLQVPDQEIQLDSIDAIVGPLPDFQPDPTAERLIDTSCPDISDENAYSLQEIKLKQEADHERALAESRKNEIREIIANMRQEFSQIRSQCEGLGIPLPVDIDPNMVPRLQAQAAAEIEQLRREKAWQVERRIVALNKLKQRYLDGILVERIELRCISRRTSVTSFRIAELTNALKKDIATVREIIATAHRMDEKRQHDIMRRTTNESVSVPATKMAQSTTTPSAQSILKGDARRQERLARGMRRAELDRLKPSASEARPVDIETIRNAEEKMGDFKLKSGDSYVVPISQRVNAVQKRRQMLLIQESIQKIKLEFNQRFLGLRDLKKRLMETISQEQMRVAQLNQIINEDDGEEIMGLESDPSEWPEIRDQVSEDDIKKFKNTLKERRLAQESAKKTNAYGGTAAAASAAMTADDDHNYNALQTLPTVHDETRLSATEQLHSELLRALPKSAMERRRFDAQMRLARHERDTLRQKIQSTIASFDDSVDELRQEKFRLEADLKQTEIKLLILYQELHLLKSFDDRESKLTAASEKSRAEKTQIVLDLTECQSKIAEKLKEITEWQEKDQRLSAEFRAVVGGEKHPAFAALFKIYKRKIKRSKKKSESNGNEDDDDGRESLDPSDDESDDDFMNDSNSDSDDDDDACPANCDNVTYERVLELRERRLDHEDQLVVFNRAVDELKQTNDRLMTREKAIDRDLKNNDAETEAFQSEKQRALNQIDVVIPLRISQFRYLTETQAAPPDSLARALIFTQTALNRLQDRIKVLQNEKQTLRKDQNDLRLQHKSLNKELRSMSAAIDVERKRCEEVQILKFGRLVDIDTLESGMSNATAIEMTGQLEKLQQQWAKKQIDIQKKISQADKQLSHVTGENTKLLHMVAALTSKQYELDRELNAASDSPQAPDSTGPSARQDVEERIRLVKLVQAQADEIDHLKAELGMLQRKGGHLYGPGSTGPDSKEHETA